MGAFPKTTLPLFLRAAVEKCSALQRAFRECHFSPMQAMGTLFEEVIGCTALEDNNEVEVRRLRKKKQKKEGGKKVKLFAGDQIQVRRGNVSKDWDKLGENTLLRPQDKNFPVVDLVASQRRGFNFTVGKNHCISAGECVKLAGGKKFDLYWVVPWYRFENNFTLAQKFVGKPKDVHKASELVDQYVVRISFDQALRALDRALGFEEKRGTQEKKKPGKAT